LFQSASFGTAFDNGCCICDEILSYPVYVKNIENFLILMREPIVAGNFTIKPV
jgi:hypothetical protein